MCGAWGIALLEIYCYKPVCERIIENMLAFGKDTAKVQWHLFSDMVYTLWQPTAEFIANVWIRKGKQRKSIYIAPFCTRVHIKRSGMDHTVLPANNTIPAFPS